MTGKGSVIESCSRRESSSQSVLSSPAQTDFIITSPAFKDKVIGGYSVNEAGGVHAMSLGSHSLLLVAAEVFQCAIRQW